MSSPAAEEIQQQDGQSNQQEVKGPAAGSPADFLKNIVGKRVKVRIGSGIDYHGLLTCLDGYMNVALEETEEVANGKVTARYGDCFVRGNNVLYISALEEI